jgi:hypothetical protein
MKLRQILIILLSLAYGHSAYAMEKPRIKRRGRIVESILKMVLISEHNRTRKTISKRVMHKAPKAQDQSEIEKPLLNQTLASEHDKARKDLSLKISETYKVRLNTLYDKALEKNQINYKTTLATELPAFREMIASLIIDLKQARHTEMHRFSNNGLNFQDISPIVNVFKKEKGFVFEPADLNLTDLETMLRYHAMLCALYYSLHEINERIRPTLETEWDI